MKSFYARGTVFLISVVGYAELAHAQTPSLRTPSLFPTPAIEHPIQNLSGGARPIANGHYSAVRTTSGYGWHAQDPPPAPSDLQPSPQVPDVPPNPLPAPKLSAPKPQPSPSSAAGAGNSGWIHGAANGYYDGYPCNDGYDYCDQSGGGIGGRFGCWFASGSGLFMQRDNAENVWTSFDTNNIASRILSSRSAEMDWAGGFETHIGRYFHEGRHALEGVYWGIFPNDEEANAYGADMVGQLSTTFSFNSLEYNDGGGAGAAVGWFDGAQRHRVRRTFEFHNAEINVLGSPDCLVFGGGDSCG